MLSPAYLLKAPRIGPPVRHLEILHGKFLFGVTQQKAKIMWLHVSKFEGIEGVICVF